jgi:hypothetical protein
VEVPVPLSEEELRMLEQMERALVEEDPKFASTLRGTSLRRSARRRAIAAGVVFAAGIAVLMAGAISGLVLLGIAGFVVMLGSAVVALTAIRGQQAVAVGDPGRSAHGLTVFDGGRSSGRTRRRSGGSSSRSQGTFMERMEARWRRRRDEGNGF